MAKLKLTYPVKGTITQGFGANANGSYSASGLLGHPAIDIVSFYDDVITDAVLSANKHYVYSLINKDYFDLMRYRGVVQIIEADDGVFELCYGHCNKITCQLGPTVFGQPLATEGNTGSVFIGNREVTAAEKNAGSHLGFHVHFQLRRLKKVREGTMRTLSLANGSDFVDSDGWHFDVPNYDNGFNGCIDPMQFIIPQLNYYIGRDLDYGSFGTDVFQLQKRLVRLGFASFTPTGFFGSMTRTAVMAYQEANGIEQVGRVGPKTRLSLNS